MAYPYPYPPQAQPSASAPKPVIPRVVIIGSQYCAPYTVDLAVVKKVKTIPDGRFVVTDINNNIIFKILKGDFSLHHRRVLVDAAGHPILTLRGKVMTMHDRWEAFRGESTDARDLIFTFKQSSLKLDKPGLDVFLANNYTKDVCDFKIKGSWSERSYTVYAGESNNIVAQMHTKHVVQSILVGKDHFTITVYPNIDHAFIVALIVILDEINKAADDITKATTGLEIILGVISLSS